MCYKWIMKPGTADGRHGLTIAAPSSAPSRAGFERAGEPISNKGTEINMKTKTAAKHTPGPWSMVYSPETERYPDGEYAGKTDSYRIGVRAHDDARINYAPEVRETAHEIAFVKTNQADARLIAAAPETAAERDRLKEINADLLAALKMLAREYDLERGPCDPGSTAGIVRAAIAKAEGK